MKSLLKKINWKIISILVLAAFVRFGGLTWCFPYTPHPDEWNMAAAASRLSWEEKLNPHFFAYGQFPLYLTYFSATVYNLIPWIKIKAINTQEAIFFLRFWSALAGTATVYLVYLVSQKIFSSKKLLTLNFELLTATLAAFTPGLIQNSHFGTTESLLTFFFLLIIYLCFLILDKEKIKHYIFLGIILGLALGTKISSLIFGFPVFLVLIMKLSEVFKNKNKLKNLGTLFLKNLVLLVFLVLFVLLTSPYLVLAFKDSRGTLLYETSVATGQSPVFYTRQFINTQPILFQLEKILPYVLGWPIFILGILGFILMFFLSFRRKSESMLIFPSSEGKKVSLITNHQLLITVFSFLTYFLFQAFLFTKWTRFMAPIFPFFPIFAVLFYQKISLIIPKKLFFIFYFLSFILILPGIFFSQIYFRPDIRFRASDWIYQNIPSGTKVLFDTGNVVDIPISSPSYPSRPSFPSYSLISFDFYHLDENPELFPQLLEHLENSDYIFVPSRRIFANHLRFPDKYPKIAKYYQLLFSGRLGFKEIKIFYPFPSIQYSVFPAFGRDPALGGDSIQLSDEAAEETWSVFDHPVIRIYQKKVNYTQSDYENLFK